MPAFFPTSKAIVLSPLLNTFVAGRGTLNNTTESWGVLLLPHSKSIFLQGSNVLVVFLDGSNLFMSVFKFSCQYRFIFEYFLNFVRLLPNDASSYQVLYFNKIVAPGFLRICVLIFYDLFAPVIRTQSKLFEFHLAISILFVFNDWLLK